MDLSNLALSITNDFPIQNVGTHDGKVRSVYWLSKGLSDQLKSERNYAVHDSVELGIMIISDRISAFDEVWISENGLTGVPGKGMFLNAVSEHWFREMEKEGIADNHLVEAPHPYIWVVEKTPQQIMVEGIARNLITGSMWRAYEKGERTFGGVTFPDGLKQNDMLEQMILTPTTKGTLRGIPGVPESEDAKVTLEQIQEHYQAFGFKTPEDVDVYMNMIAAATVYTTETLQGMGKLFVDTKGEGGYLINPFTGEQKIGFIDEWGTPDSSRIADLAKYEQGVIYQEDKEPFRQFLLDNFDRELLLDGKRVPERKAYIRSQVCPATQMFDTSARYKAIAETIVNQTLAISDNPRKEIMDTLSDMKVLE